MGTVLSFQKCKKQKDQIAEALKYYRDYKAATYSMIRSDPDAQRPDNRST
jgi:hypothetical protein